MRPAKDLEHNAHVVVTTREDGDQRVQFPTIQGVARARDHGGSLPLQSTNAPWTFVHQVHGCTVVCVDTPEGPMAVDADALITTAPDVPLAVLGADCSLIALASPEGVIGAVHAGWKGLYNGVIEKSVQAMHERGATRLEAVIGPTIGAECYAFSPSDLDPLLRRYGEHLQVNRSDGSCALDLVAGVTAALSGAGIASIAQLGGCTACDERFYSWRARRDDERHALVVWSEGTR